MAAADVADEGAEGERVDDDESGEDDGHVGLEAIAVPAPSGGRRTTLA